MKKIITLLLIFSTAYSYAQDDSLKIAARKKALAPLKPVKYLLNEDGSNFIQFTGLIQTWIRFNGSNPGTTVNNQKAPQTFDIGLRRVRFQLMGQLTDRIFFYSQLGMNSISFQSERKFGFFIHDATGEYAFIKKHLSVGAGLGTWVGPLRFSAPAVAGIMAYDAPIFQQTTNDINDQFGRKFMAYAKGKIGKLDYRVSVSKPWLVNSVNPGNVPINGGQTAVPVLGALANDVSTFSTRDPNPQFNGYFDFEFFDQESNLVPFHVGSYYGAKKIFNIGGGIQYQNQAVWHKHLNETTGKTDTVSSNLLIAGVDVIYDAPLNKEKGTAISIYACYMYSDYGTNYIRTFGPMNPADSRSLVGGHYNSGGGTAFPINGTGSTLFAQAGYKFKTDLLGNLGTLMPYAMSQGSKYENFDDWMVTYDLGVNWILKGQNSKFSFDYSNRPFYFQKIASDPIKTNTRRGAFIIQYQVAF